MCEPTMIVSSIGLIGSAIGDVAEHNAQQDAADKNKAAAEQNAALANQQITLRQMQEQQASRQSIFQSDLAARQADAQARVMAGESGVAGASVDMVLSDIERQRLNNQQTAETNLQMTTDQLQQQRLGVDAQRQQQINSVAPPNPFATALRIGGSAVEAAGTYLRNKPRVGAGGG